MHDVITLEPATGTDQYNNFTFGTPVETTCYMQRRNIRALDKSGREVTSAVQLILANPDLAVSVNDRLTLPDGSRRAIIEVLGAPNENGEPYWLEVRA